MLHYSPIGSVLLYASIFFGIINTLKSHLGQRDCLLTAEEFANERQPPVEPHLAEGVERALAQRHVSLLVDAVATAAVALAAVDAQPVEKWKFHYLLLFSSLLHWSQQIIINN